ncbi:GNAT family N-acetyltransferase [Carnimonas bestiolae]|uniref:GNAT family N-acetyltransferase n=1 Tax=Carnimonas bestiolae TaxID=3402172 RepID=UPI003EDBCEBC
MPAFVAPFNLLTTADDDLLHKLQRIPGYRYWSTWLTINTAFVGTTVSEYALFSPSDDPDSVARDVRAQLGRDHRLVIIKDIPQASPLLSDAENRYADQLVSACRAQGFLAVDGQALAYVPIDFPDIDSYLARLKKSSRRYIKRRLRTRDEVQVIRCATGHEYDNQARVDEYYALYSAVYDQSDIHFDLLTREFFGALLSDTTADGIVFEYRRAADHQLLGFNLCYEEQGRLIDKYIGLRYPDAKELSLYFLSWVVNLEYALERGLSAYVAGWTDPAVKAMLGASFTATRHAVLVRNPLLRWVLNRFADRLSPDSEWVTEQEAS